MSKFLYSQKRLKSQKNPTTTDSTDSGVLDVPPGVFRRCKILVRRFNCSGSYLLKLVGFIGAKLGCKFRQKSHNNTIGIIWIILYIGPYIFGNFFQSFFFLGGKLLFFLMPFFWKTPHVWKVPKETCPVVALGVFFRWNHTNSEGGFNVAVVDAVDYTLHMGTCYIRQRCGTAEKWLWHDVNLGF